MKTGTRKTSPNSWSAWPIMELRWSSKWRIFDKSKWEFDLSELTCGADISLVDVQPRLCLSGSKTSRAFWWSSNSTKPSRVSLFLHPKCHYISLTVIVCAKSSNLPGLAHISVWLPSSTIVALHPCLHF